MRNHKVPEPGAIPAAGEQKAGQESQWGVAKGQQLPSLSIHYFLLFSLSCSKPRENPAGRRFGLDALGRGQEGVGPEAWDFIFSLTPLPPTGKEISDININISTWFSVFGVIRIEQVGSSESWCRC